jgi:hypothetical protein
VGASSARTCSSMVSLVFGEKRPFSPDCRRLHHLCSITPGSSNARSVVALKPPVLDLQTPTREAPLVTPLIPRPPPRTRNSTIQLWDSQGGGSGLAGDPSPGMHQRQHRIPRNNARSAVASTACLTPPLQPTQTPAQPGRKSRKAPSHHRRTTRTTKKIPLTTRWFPISCQRAALRRIRKQGPREPADSSRVYTFDRHVSADLEKYQYTFLTCCIYTSCSNAMLTTYGCLPEPLQNHSKDPRPPQYPRQHGSVHR